MIQQAIILCGGKGTRLGSRTKDFPKPLLSVAGKALLDRTLDTLAAAGIKRAVLAAGFRADLIEDHYAENPHPSIEVQVYTEPAPMGTAGALRLLRNEELLDEDFLIVYGDIFLDFDPTGLMEQHLSTGALATLLVRESDHPWDSDLIDASCDGVVKAMIPRSQRDPDGLYRNIGNAAFYAAKRSLVEYIPADASTDYAKDIFPAALDAGADLRVHWLPVGGYVKDMGTPDRLDVVEQYLADQALITAARQNPQPISEVFLDRDGTINREDGHLTSAANLVFLDGAVEGVALLKQHGCRCFLTTNQPGIARGLFTEEALSEIHQSLTHQLEAGGGALDGIYYSPFHPETHHGEGVQELRRGSDCRKPGIGMLLKATAEHSIDLRRAVIIGDTARDVLAGKAAGIRTVLIGSEALAAELSPDLRVDSLLEAAEAIRAGVLDQAQTTLSSSAA